MSNLKETSVGKDAGSGDGKGSPAPTPPKPRTICGVPLIPQPHGGALLAGGMPGNPGGGRIADKVRLDATKGLEPEVSRIAGLLSKMVGRAESELGEDGSLDKALATMREIGRIANTLTSIGPGTKVTNVLERPEWVAWTRECMEEAGVPSMQIAEALRLLAARIGGSSL